MTSQTCPPVSVSRTIEVPAEKLFGILAHSARHPLIDGSGMLREVPRDVVVSGVGDVFVMKMHNDEMGDYEMSNQVVEYELNRRIGWEPFMTAATREEDQASIGNKAGHRWSYDLVPAGSGATLVTETYDCSRSPARLRQAVRGGDRWVASMTATLEKLAALAKSEAPPNHP
jgi:uncharacterized protein YndB with AHSA1/START domain